MTFDMDRRMIFRLGLTGAALSLGGTGFAAPAKSDIKDHGFHRFMMGDFEFTTILDGERIGDGPYPTFGSDQKPEVVAALLEENFLPSTRFVNGFTPTLINTGAELVLIDTGMGQGGRENGMGLLRERMVLSGYRPEDVTLVLLTHMHGDHIGGLMEGTTPAFANARYACAMAEYDFWTRPELLGGNYANGAKSVARLVVPLRDKLTFLVDGDEVISGIKAISAPGHTPGHMVFEIASKDRTLMMTGDCANHYVASLQRPDWQVAYDMDKAQAAKTRWQIFGRIAKQRIPFIGYHMPFPAVGFVKESASGFDYNAATYQFAL